ncbi:hypothetical protein Sme01_59460 [Sphaerisporangium melleum]|uniref:Uncharacterized protein n=1 Tax=Sphaerisporangium melleum TaxID=321316 RepID=A0A917R6V4_9ACTN|nr:hypothetical protein [Sphaerisporangium melleum]GGK92904.1 hypothetical protein GCM10007964_39270 [Sphaerisporangium melleum]GII73470.1 hypothetical protein Sme01_59460 [Sphaerisporangium melleum]
MVKTIIAAVGTVFLVALVVVTVRIVTSPSADVDGVDPADPAAPTAHRVESPGPAEDYWTEERMRDASPAPAPVHTD